MQSDSSNCPFHLAYDLQFKELAQDIHELKQRAGTLEATLNRGLMLLVANLASVVVMLAHELIRP